MEISDIEKTRKRLFAFSCIGISLSIVIGFTIVDFIEGDILEFTINILSGAVFTASLITIKKFEADLVVYRTALILLSTFLVYNVLIGAGKGTAIFWLFPFPLVFVFFLGRKEGSIFFAVFFMVLSILLINPFSFEIHSYDIGLSLRFLSSLLLVSLMAYGLEASREKYGHLLIEKNRRLEEEKQNLEQALGEIKTLSGLIPICSNCKKIRDDKGYWQQVETYVRAHSDADFTHGICPDCIKELYPEYKYLRKK